LTVRRGYELNYALLTRLVENHQGELKAESSFLRLEPENTVLTAAKRAEDDDSLILRFYECPGKETDFRRDKVPASLCPNRNATAFLAFFTRSLDHHGRGVNPAHSALRAKAPLGSDCAGSIPTAHIQN